ncbi:MAG: YdcF family protein [Pirellulaceae bacterium]|jgi:hypothetical protein|nr:YdcF family protein [Pirellulaceae bacterium]
MKTGVLIHGCNLNAENWRYVAWGNAPDQMGRVPQGLLAAWEFQADAIVMGTGASKKKYTFPDSPRTGEQLVEADYTFEFLKTHLDDLLRFDQFSRTFSGSSAPDWESCKRWFVERIHLDTASSNTVTELQEAGQLFVERHIERVVLVSSPTHLIRVVRDATDIFQGDDRFAPFRDHLLAMPSATSYEGSSAGDVVVVEPPHRPDRHVVPTHRRIARMMQLQQLAPATLVNFIGELDELLQRYEDLKQKEPQIEARVSAN